MTGTATLDERLLSITENFSGRVGYAVVHPATGREITLRPDEWFPTASAIKLPLLSVVHGLVASGELTWSDQIPVPDGRGPGGSGILQHLDRPRVLSLRDLAWLMTCVSDNLATNTILDVIGFDRAAELIRALVGSGLELDKPAGNPDGGPLTRSMGRATPAGLLRYVRRLARGDYPGAGPALRTASEQQSHAGIARYLPVGGDAELVVANKAGALPGIRTDIGVVRRGSDAVGIVVLTDSSADLDYAVDNEGERCIGAISRAVCLAWLGVPA